MLVLDSQGRENWRVAAKAEANAAARRKDLADEILSNTVSVEDDGTRDVSNLLAQLGRPLRSIDVQERLKRICPSLEFERSMKYPELTGVYLRKWMRQPTGGWKQERIHLMGMESGIMPEFSVLHKKKTKIANPELFGGDTPIRDVDWKEVDTFASETRGWRTVLVRLLHLGIITRLDVEKHFGWTPSVESRKWRERTDG